MAARAFICTSGSGVSLMREFITSYIAEITATIFDVQRGGPSTGMPTRTQTEIALNGDRATGRILCLSPWSRTRPSQAAGLPSWVDAYLGTAGGWRIASREEECCFSHNFAPKSADEINCLNLEGPPT
jgi:hypothetical protein